MSSWCIRDLIAGFYIQFISFKRGCSELFTILGRYVLSNSCLCGSLSIVIQPSWLLNMISLLRLVNSRSIHLLSRSTCFSLTAGVDRGTRNDLLLLVFTYCYALRYTSRILSLVTKSFRRILQPVEPAECVQAA